MSNTPTQGEAGCRSTAHAASRDRSGMPPHPLGSTGLSVSRLGLGLAALGRPAYINLGTRAETSVTDRSGRGDSQRRQSARGLDAAYAAEMPGRGRRAVGRDGRSVPRAAWLSDTRACPSDAITIGSKWGYTYVADWRLNASIHEVKDLSVATLRRQIAESRALLGSRLQLYQIHSATVESGVLDDIAVLRELHRLRSGGARDWIDRHRTQAGGGDPPRLAHERRWSQSLSGRAGHLELAGGVGGASAGRRKGGGMGRYHQGSARQRSPYRPSRTRTPPCSSEDRSCRARYNHRRTGPGSCLVAAVGRCRVVWCGHCRTAYQQSQVDWPGSRRSGLARARGASRRSYSGSSKWLSPGSDRDRPWRCCRHAQLYSLLAPTLQPLSSRCCRMLEHQHPPPESW